LEVVAMVVLIALIGAAIVGLLMWKAMTAMRDDEPARPPARRARVKAPDDDPDFLRQLDERRRRGGEEQPGR
jgi:uncharacterized iron-regulated membrane protein